MSEPITVDLGAVTAYADAVEQGYTGTREEFGELLANFAKRADEVKQDKEEVKQAKDAVFSKAESLALDTEPDFRTWFASNPITLQYVLATPIETDLSEAQIQAYKSLTTFKPTSIISNDAGAWMGASYVADTKLYIDNKIQEIASAIIASASEAE